MLNVRRIHSGGLERFRACVTTQGRRRVGPVRSTRQEAAADARDLRRFGRLRTRWEGRTSKPSPAKPAALTSAPVRGLTVGEGLGLYLETLKPDSRPAWAPTCRTIAQHFGARRALAAILPADVAGFAALRIGALGTRRAFAAREGLVLRFLARRGGLVWPRAVFQPRQQGRAAAGSPAGLLALCERIEAEPAESWRLAWGEDRERAAALVRLVLLSGLTVAEAARVRAEDLDPERLALHLPGRTPEHPPALVALAALPEARRCLETLRARCAEPAALVLPEGARGLARMLARWRRRLDAPGLTVRALREAHAACLTSSPEAFARLDPRTAARLASLTPNPRAS